MKVKALTKIRKHKWLSNGEKGAKETWVCTLCGVLRKRLQAPRNFRTHWSMYTEAFVARPPFGKAITFRPRCNAILEGI